MRQGHYQGQVSVMFFYVLEQPYKLFLVSHQSFRRLTDILSLADGHLIKNMGW